VRVSVWYPCNQTMRSTSMFLAWSRCFAGSRLIHYFPDLFLGDLASRTASSCLALGGA
jgi:hypothetical protein